ncbi:ACP S-malonyltransferase [Thermodesulfobacteriota bacterium]
MTQKIAFLFPGQGSQFIGMGHDLMHEFPEVKNIFQQVDDICQKPISKLCFEGPLDELTLTVNLQPAITAVNLSCLHALNQNGVYPIISAGHSLGEYAALVSTGIVSSFDALKLVQKRGELMHREAVANPGAMAAVIGMDVQRLSEIIHIAKENGILAIANHNTAEQIVITGGKEALSRALAIIKKEGGKAIPLKVSGAWHCDLMKKAVNDFRQFITDIPFSTPSRKLLFNATADSESEPEKIKDIMAQQLISPVKWFDIIQAMFRDEIDIFVEVGPKKVLTGLFKKILTPTHKAKMINIEDMKSLESALGMLP